MRVCSHTSAEEQEWRPSIQHQRQDLWPIKMANQMVSVVFCCRRVGSLSVVHSMNLLLVPAGGCEQKIARVAENSKQRVSQTTHKSITTWNHCNRWHYNPQGFGLIYVFPNRIDPEFPLPLKGSRVWLHLNAMQSILINFVNCVNSAASAGR